MPRVKANNIELHYRESGTGREPLVLVHGWVSAGRPHLRLEPRRGRRQCDRHCGQLGGGALCGKLHGPHDRPESSRAQGHFLTDVIGSLRDVIVRRQRDSGAVVALKHAKRHN
jgi:hypothetical protein